MGACVSRPKGWATRLSKNKKNGHRKKRIIRRRVCSSNKSTNPQLQGERSMDSAWFDCTSVMDSERGDDEFYSVYDDVVSLNGSESALQRTREGGGDESDRMQGLGVVQNNCQPCIPSSSPLAVENKLSFRKRLGPSMLSFKWREGHAAAPADPTLVSPRAVVRRPIAGSTIPYCPMGKRMADCWSPLEPNTFKVRGKNYLRDKKKELAPNCAAYYPFGVDIFLSQRKIDHIARFVELPVVNVDGDVPSILVVNVQIPLYPISMFQSEHDGEGMNLVMYFKLSESYSKDLPSHFHDSLTKFINDEVERVRGFPVDTIAPFRERLKILGRIVNMDELSKLNLNTAERKLMNACNEKPVLSRPQHEFYLGENYFEIDLDLHRFSYVSRKGIESFHERMKISILDFGLTIQGNKAEELPEHILCCVRLDELDYNNRYHLGT
ncbi:hypothetical protein ACLB2K_067926 [Fragaria x ananassa]